MTATEAAGRIMKNVAKIITVIMFSTLLCACEKWPPYADELRENFENNRTAFDALEAKIVATEYLHVSKTGIYGIPRFNDSKSVVADKQGDEYIDSDFIEDDPEWDDLLVQANVFAVAHENDVVTLRFSGAIEQDERVTHAEYIHSNEMHELRRPCLAEYKKLDCGLCSVELADDWYIEYWWSPEEVVPAGYDSVLEGKISDDEYWSLFDEGLSQCRKDGYEAIGYDMSRAEEKPEDQP